MIPASMARNVARQIKRYSSGAVTLVRTTTGTPGADTPWEPGAPSLDVFTLDARVDGVTDDHLADGAIVATDLVVIASPKATNSNGAVVDFDPRMTDVLRIDGAAKSIKKIEAVPAGGPPARFNIFVAS